MKRGIYSVILLTLLATSQQVKPFIDPFSLGMMGFGFAMNAVGGGSVTSFVQAEIMKAVAAALVQKAQEGAKAAKGYNDEIFALKKQMTPVVSTMFPEKMVVLKKTIADLEQKRDKEVGMAHRIAGVLAPTLGLISNVSTAYGAVSGIASYFGYGVPVLPGSSSLLNYMGYGK